MYRSNQRPKQICCEESPATAEIKEYERWQLAAGKQRESVVVYGHAALGFSLCHSQPFSYRSELHPGSDGAAVFVTFNPQRFFEPQPTNTSQPPWNHFIHPARDQCSFRMVQPHACASICPTSRSGNILDYRPLTVLLRLVVNV